MEDNLRDKIFSATDGGLTILKDLYPGLTDENGQVRRQLRTRRRRGRGKREAGVSLV